MLFLFITQLFSSYSFYIVRKSKPARRPAAPGRPAAETAAAAAIAAATTRTAGRRTDLRNLVSDNIFRSAAQTLVAGFTHSLGGRGRRLYRAVFLLPVQGDAAAGRTLFIAVRFERNPHREVFTAGRAGIDTYICRFQFQFLAVVIRKQFRMIHDFRHGYLLERFLAAFGAGAASPACLGALDRPVPQGNGCQGRPYRDKPDKT